MTPITDKLAEAAQAVIDRWDSPLWKDLPHTGESINELRQALAELEAQGGQAGEPVAWVVKKPGGYCDVGYKTDVLNKLAHGTKLYTHPQPSTSEVRDAERYRWLRDENNDSAAAVVRDYGIYDPAELDAFIDAAIQAKQAKGTP